MTNSSATGGYLTPLTEPIMGQALSRLLQQAIVSITGLPDTLVRPRWQAEPGNIPTEGTVWASVGISRRVPEGTAWQWFADGTETYTLQRQEEITILCSFYDTGIDQEADRYAAILREGLQLGQNREVLRANGFGFIAVGDMIPLPTLLKQRWLYRVDVPIRFLRTMTWTYNVLSVLSAQAVVQFEKEDGSLYTKTIAVPA